MDEEMVSRSGSWSSQLAYLPHAVTLLRVPFTAVGYWATLTGRIWLIFVAVAAAIASDLVDGRLTRWLDVESEFGSNLDSWVDAVFYISLVAWTGYLTEALFEGLVGVVVGAIVLLYAGAFLAAWILIRDVSVHTLLSRTVATLVILTCLYYIAAGFVWWLLVPIVVLGIADLAKRVSLIREGLEAKEDPTGTS